MSHLLDYDETIPMPRLDRSWYQDVPVAVQRAAMGYTSELRVILNQRTKRFVVVYEVGELAEDYWMDWNGSKLVGWMPVFEIGYDPNDIEFLIANLHRMDQRRKHGDGKAASDADAQAIKDEQEAKDTKDDEEWDGLRDEFVRDGQKQAVWSIPGQSCRPNVIGREDAPTEKVIVYPGHPNWR